MARLQFALVLVLMIRSMSRDRGNCLVRVAAGSSISVMEYLGAHMKLPKEHHRRSEVQQECQDRSSENVHEGRRFRDG